MSKDILHIFAKKHLSVMQRFNLVAAYLKIRIIRLVINRLISEKQVRSISVLGYTVWINKFSDFYWTFKEIFIDEEYYFKSSETHPVILDVGGHIGVATLYFKWLYPKAVITVFEPMPENIEKLEKNIKVNKLEDVTLVKKAVDAKEGTFSFAGEGRAGHIIGKTTSNSIEVPVTTLSKYFDKKVSFCKMDIEGSEAAVIKELEMTGKLLNINHLVMEYHKKDCGNKMSDIIDAFEKEAMLFTFMGNINALDLKKRNFTHIMLVAMRKIT